MSRKIFIGAIGVFAMFACLATPAQAREDYFKPAIGDVVTSAVGLERAITTNDGGLNLTTENGDPIAGFPIILADKTIVSSPVLADITGDDTEEIIFVARDSANKYFLYAYDGQAVLLGFTALGNAAITFDPIELKISGQAKRDVVLATNAGTIIDYHFQNGGFTASTLLSLAAAAGVSADADGANLVINYPGSKKLSIYHKSGNRWTLNRDIILAQAVPFSGVFGGDGLFYGVNKNNQLVAYDLATGNLGDGFPVDLGGPAIDGPVLSDVDSDNPGLELVVPLSGSKIVVARLQGNILLNNLVGKSFVGTDGIAANVGRQGIFAAIRGYASGVFDKIDKKVVSVLSKVKFGISDEFRKPHLAVSIGDQIIASGGVYNFGREMATSSIKEVTLTLTNSGLDDLILSGSPAAFVTGTNANFFTVSVQPTSTIFHGASTMLAIQLDLSSAGSKSAVLQIPNNDAGNNPYILNLAGSISQNIIPAGNYSLSFDGVNDYIQTNIDVDESTSTPGYTFEAWVYPTETSLDRWESVFSTRNSATANQAWEIMRFNGYWYVRTGNKVTYMLPSQTNTWQHIAAIFTPGQGIKFYKNGIEIATPDIGYTTSDANLMIGRNISWKNDYFKGNIDEVRVWNRPLSVEEIKLNRTTYRTGSEDGLLAYYRFDEGQGQTVYDYAEANNGRLGNLDSVDDADPAWSDNMQIGKSAPSPAGSSGLAFNGVNTYVETPLGIDESASTTGYTFEAWVYPTGTSMTKWEPVFSTKYMNGSWSLYRYAGWWYVVTGESVRYALTAESNTWQHVAVVFKPNNQGISFYKNGVEFPIPHIGYLAANSPFNSPVTIGRTPFRNEYFAGTIDEFSVWNRPLTTKEIKNNMGGHLTGKENNLLAYWRFDEGQGQTVYDSAGFNHGHLGSTGDVDVNDPVWTVDGFLAGEENPAPVTSSALSFNGTSNYMEAPLYVDQTASTTGATLEAWVYPTAGNNNKWEPILTTSYINSAWSIWVYNGYFYVNTGTSRKYAMYPADQNTWQHIAAVFIPGQGVKFYKNGTEYLIPEIGYNDSNYELMIGKRAYRSEFYTGKIDEVRIWNRPLAIDEVRNNYGASHLVGNEPGLTAYYRFDEGQGQTVYDYAGDYNARLGDTNLAEVTDPTWSAGGFTAGEENPAVNAASSTLSFDGVNDYVETNLVMDMTASSTGATFEFWVYPTATSSGRQYVFSSNGWDIFQMNGWWYANNGKYAMSDFQVELNKWQHIALVMIPGQGARFFKDSQSALRPYISYSNVNNGVLFGRRWYNGDYFKGQIDEARIWDRQLTDQELTSSVLGHLQGNELGLRGWWTFDEGIGQTAYDYAHDYNGRLGTTGVADTADPVWVQR